jgi:hypothetical protein
MMPSGASASLLGITPEEYRDLFSPRLPMSREFYRVSQKRLDRLVRSIETSFSDIAYPLQAKVASRDTSASTSLACRYDMFHTNLAIIGALLSDRSTRSRHALIEPMIAKITRNPCVIPVHRFRLIASGIRIARPRICRARVALLTRLGNVARNRRLGVSRQFAITYVSPWIIPRYCHVQSRDRRRFEWECHFEFSRIDTPVKLVIVA